MNRFKINDRCYFCDTQGMSKEHIPPKCIFPESKDLPGTNYRENLIWVPSCEKHNSEKSNDDEYLLIILLLNTFSNNVAFLHAKSKIFRLLQKYPGKIKKALTNLENLNDIGKNKNIIYEIDLPRLNMILNRIICGLYLYDFNRYIRSGTIELLYWDLIDLKTREHYNIGLHQETLRIFEKIENHAVHKEIFYYQYIHSEKYDLIRLVFYENWNAVFRIITCT